MATEEGSTGELISSVGKIPDDLGNFGKTFNAIMVKHVYTVLDTASGIASEKIVNGSDTIGDELLLRNISTISERSGVAMSSSSSQKQGKGTESGMGDKNAMVNIIIPDGGRVDQNTLNINASVAAAWTWSRSSTTWSGSPAVGAGPCTQLGVVDKTISIGARLVYMMTGINDRVDAKVWQYAMSLKESLQDSGLMCDTNVINSGSATSSSPGTRLEFEMNKSAQGAPDLVARAEALCKEDHQVGGKLTSPPIADRAVI
ncbi:MAG: hypothetical protein JZU60_04395 [Ilumatobacteraceae bacterium]|nr:hypothetical protein [Ilumatobacteraceae bacterium]